MSVERKRSHLIGAGLVAAALCCLQGVYWLFPRTYGHIAAQGDLLLGRIIVKKVGAARPGYLKAKARLKREYGIEIEEVGGYRCWQQMNYLAAYNEVINQEIVRRFGKDVVGDAFIRAEIVFLLEQIPDEQW